MNSRISKITVGRLFNLGNYEHVRYELTVDVPEGQSATQAITAVEAILEGMKPVSRCGVPSQSEIAHAEKSFQAMRSMNAVDFQRNYGHCEGTPAEIIDRHEQSLVEAKAKRASALATAKQARALFDDLGGASQWKDAKLDWDDEPNV